MECNAPERLFAGRYLQVRRYSMVKNYLGPLSIFGAGLAALALIIAWYLQHFLGQLPCPLCIFQRYAYLLVTLSLLAATFSYYFSKIKVNALFLLSLLASMLGIAVAARHLWILHHPSLSCGVDKLEQMVNSLFTAHWWPGMFASQGTCSAELPAVLGLSLPLWSLIGMVALSCINTLLLVLGRRHSR